MTVLRIHSVMKAQHPQQELLALMVIQLIQAKLIAWLAKMVITQQIAVTV